MIIKTAVPTHPAAHGWYKGFMCHYKPNCWALKPGNSFWPQDFVLPKYPSRALMILLWTLAFSTCSLKICKNPSVRPEFLGGTHTERTQSENLHNGISCTQLLKFVLRGWVDNLHQEWECTNSFSNSWLQSPSPLLGFFSPHHLILDNDKSIRVRQIKSHSS